MSLLAEAGKIPNVKSSRNAEATSPAPANNAILKTARNAHLIISAAAPSYPHHVERLNLRARRSPLSSAH